MTLHDELLARNNGNPIDAAAELAAGLMQDEPEILKVGYSYANATLAALEMFPEINEAKQWRLDTALRDLLEAGQDGARRGSTARGGGNVTTRGDGAGECRHCGRAIKLEGDGEYGWIDPEATGDDSIWREVCDSHDTFIANHEPQL